MAIADAPSATVPAAGAGDGNEAERLALLEAHRLAVRAQPRAMERNLDAIGRKIELYRERIAT